MDFTMSEELTAVDELANRILAEHAAPDRLSAVEAAGGFDDDLWRALADTGLLGVALPEPVGGGLGFLAVHVLAEAAGRHLAHVPLMETAVTSLALADSLAPADLVQRAAIGELVPTLALQEPDAPADRPATIADVSGADAAVTGTKVVVPWADRADGFLVSARVGEHGGPRLVWVERSEVSVRPNILSTDVPHGTVDLDQSRGVLIGGDDAFQALLERATAALSAHQAGMLDAVVELAARYTSEREQFGRAIATFQAVSQRVAGAFIDTECARLTALEASWRLHEGLPASDEVAIAKWWAAEAGHRVMHAAQHVHGGVGVDREYPLHRWYLRTKQVEFALGSRVDQLGRLGASLATSVA